MTCFPQILLNNHIFQHVFSFTIDGKSYQNKVNTAPAEFKNVKIFLSNSWQNVAEGSVQNFVVETSK